MARLTNTIVGNKGYGIGRNTPMVHLDYGGQFGQQTEMAQYVSSAPYVRRNLIALVIECPRGFDDLPDPEYWRSAFKNLIELHPKSIEGYNAQLTVETQETPFGGAGEMIESPSNVTRARSNPSFSYVERYGRPISTFFDMWILELIMDPISKVPNVVTRTGANIADLLPDYIGATVLVFEPDPTYTKVDKAWLTTSMFPKAGAPVEGRRDMTAGGEQLEFSIEFTGISTSTAGVVAFAQKLLDEMNLTGANPNLRPAFVDQISADVKAAETGYANQIANAARTAVAV